MVNKCCAYGCKSGYASQDATDVHVTFHSFPRDEELRAKWIRANPRKDFTPTKNSRLCSLHFAESDFVEQHCDSNATRRASFDSPQLHYCSAGTSRKMQCRRYFLPHRATCRLQPRHPASLLPERPRLVADYKTLRDWPVSKKLSQLTTMLSL